jgi:hypothetical protein
VDFSARWLGVACLRACLLALIACCSSTAFPDVPSVLSVTLTFSNGGGDRLNNGQVMIAGVDKDAFSNTVKVRFRSDGVSDYWIEWTQTQGSVREGLLFCSGEGWQAQKSARFLESHLLLPSSERGLFTPCQNCADPLKIIATC